MCYSAAFATVIFLTAVFMPASGPLSNETSTVSDDCLVLDGTRTETSQNWPQLKPLVRICISSSELSAMSETLAIGPLAEMFAVCP